MVFVTTQKMLSSPLVWSPARSPKQELNGAENAEDGVDDGVQTLAVEDRSIQLSIFNIW